MKTELELRAMTLKELRRYAIERGLGITYLSERKKDELVRLIVQLQA